MFPSPSWAYLLILAVVLTVPLASCSGRQRHSYARHPNSIRRSGRNPVILIPGNGGSQIFVKLDKPNVTHYYCDRKTDYYFNLWLNLELMVPFVVDCWTDNMRLVFNASTNTTHNAPGVDIKIPDFGNTSTIEFLDPSKMDGTGYFDKIVEVLLSAGYRRGIDIRGAPYDFRKAPNELGFYYWKLKRLFVDTYYMNGNKPIIAICHSMGCPIMLYFLRQVSDKWKTKYIKSLVTLGAPWGGAIKSLKAFTSGDNLGVFVVKSLWIREDERTFPSLAYLLPSDKFWAPDEVLLTDGIRNFTVANLPEFFQRLNYDVGHRMWLLTRNLTYNLEYPNIEVHCLHGHGIPTMEYLQYKNSTFPNEQPNIRYGDGDGTVNLRSLQGCLRWKEDPNQLVYYQNFTNAEHLALLRNPGVLDYVRRLVSLSDEQNAP